MVLVVDTASAQAFIGLWDDKWVTAETFVAGRELNSVILTKLENTFLRSAERRNVVDAEKSDKKPISGVIVNAGPGSFTGLRIGISIANTVAYTYVVPIVGVKDVADVDNLLQKGLSMLESRGASFGEVVIPHYGAEPHITRPLPKG